MVICTYVHNGMFIYKFNFDAQYVKIFNFQAYLDSISFNFCFELQWTSNSLRVIFLQKIRFVFIYFN